MSACLAGWLAGWLASWLVGWLVGWAGCLDVRSDAPQAKCTHKHGACHEHLERVAPALGDGNDPPGRVNALEQRARRRSHGDCDIISLHSLSLSLPRDFVRQNKNKNKILYL